jgi:glucokinase
MDKSCALGIDLGATDIKAALVDRTGKILRRDAQPTRAELGPDAVIDRIVELIDRLRTGAPSLQSKGGGPKRANGSEHPTHKPDIVAVGIGAPGPLSPSRGIVFKAANLPKWRNVALRDRIAERIGLPVVMENDANAAAYGEYRHANDKSLQDLVLLTLGSGIGAGTILGGRIFHGHFENASEWGHMIVEPNGRPCTCGQLGCLERYASAGAIARTIVAQIERGQSSSLAGCVRAGEAVTSVDVAAAAQAGDALAQTVWDEACRYLAVACINIQHAVNPQSILLGGGMSAAGDFLLNPVRRHTEAMRWKLHDDHPDIALAQLGNDAGTIGAALLAWDSLDT